MAAKPGEYRTTLSAEPYVRKQAIEMQARPAMQRWLGSVAWAGGEAVRWLAGPAGIQHLAYPCVPLGFLKALKIRLDALMLPHALLHVPF